MERLDTPSGSQRTELTLSEGSSPGRHPALVRTAPEHHDCAYCRAAAPTAYYAISHRRWIRHWLCAECVNELWNGGWEVEPLPCAECRVPSDRHGDGHAYVPTGYGR